MAGIELADDLTIRGRDFTPMLKGLRIAWNNDLYAEYSMRHGAKTDMRCWRTPEWKLMIDFANKGRGELYDLKNDPGELKDLYESQDPQHVEIRKELKSKILNRIKEINDPLIVDLD